MIAIAFDVFVAYLLAKRINKFWLIFLIAIPIAFITSTLGTTATVLWWNILEVEYSPQEVVSKVVVGTFVTHPTLIILSFFGWRKFRNRKKLPDVPDNNVSEINKIKADVERIKLDVAALSPKNVRSKEE